MEGSRIGSAEGLDLAVTGVLHNMPTWMSWTGCDCGNYDYHLGTIKEGGTKRLCLSSPCRNKKSPNAPVRLIRATTAVGIPLLVVREPV